MPEHMNKKFFNAVRALRNKDVDPDSVSKDVVNAARQMSRADVEKGADVKRDLGRRSRPDEKEKPKSALAPALPKKKKEVKEEGVKPDNASLDLISTYSKYGKALRQTENLIDVGMNVNEIIDLAEQIVLSETESWFDEATVTRNVKEMKAHSKQFVKTLTEAQRLMERAQALYDDMGVKLNRYFDIQELQEAQDGHGVEDDASEIQHNKPKTFDVINMREENELDSTIVRDHSIGINEPNTTRTVGNAKKREDAIMDIVNSKTYKNIDGTMVDTFTATMILNTLRSLAKEENKQKFLLMPIDKMAKLAVKLNTE